MKRYAFMILTGVLCAGAIFCFCYTRKHDYDASVPVLLYSDSAQNYALNNTETILHIKGTVQKHLFRPETFSGEVWLDGMDDMKAVSQEHTIEKKHMDCTFLTGHDDAAALANTFFATLYWNDNKDHALLVVMDNERTNFTLDGFAAIGPYYAENESLWVTDELPAESFTGKPPVYDEWDLVDAFFSKPEQEFAFLQYSLQNITSSDLVNAGAIPSDTSDNTYTLYVHFAKTKLAFDTVTIEKENVVKVDFRFRTLSDYRDGLAQLEAAFEALPEEVTKEKTLDGRLCYTMEGGEKTTSLEITAYPEQYQIEVRIH